LNYTYRDIYDTIETWGFKISFKTAPKIMERSENENNFENFQEDNSGRH